MTNLEKSLSNAVFKAISSAQEFIFIATMGLDASNDTELIKLQKLEAVHQRLTELQKDFINVYDEKPFTGESA